MRCPDCNKFVSYDEPNCEVGSVDVDVDVVRSNVTVQLNCADCGTTLKDAEIEAEETIDHECKPQAERKPEWKPDPEWKEGDDQFEITEDGDATGTERTETKDRNGKQITSARYMKKFYGFELDSIVKCLKCGETFSIKTTGEEQASGFNEQ